MHPLRPQTGLQTVSAANATRVEASQDSLLSPIEPSRQPLVINRTLQQLAAQPPTRTC